MSCFVGNLKVVTLPWYKTEKSLTLQNLKANLIYSELVYMGIYLKHVQAATTVLTSDSCRMKSNP